MCPAHATRPVSRHREPAGATVGASTPVFVAARAARPRARRTHSPGIRYTVPTPHLLPEEPDFAPDNGAERRVWDALREQLPDEALLFSGVGIQDGRGEHEIDRLVAWPGIGLAAIEVKGGDRAGRRPVIPGQRHPPAQDRPGAPGAGRPARPPALPRKVGARRGAGPVSAPRRAPGDGAGRRAGQP